MVVPVDTSPDPATVSNKALRAMEYEHRLNTQERFTGWAVIWVLFGFKLGTVALIWFIARGSADRQSGEAAAYVASTTWYWFIIPVIALSGAVAYRLRLRAARKRVEEFRKAEFLAHHEPIPADDHHSLTEDEKQRLGSLVGRREDMEGHDA